MNVCLRAPPVAPIRLFQTSNTTLIDGALRVLGGCVPFGLSVGCFLIFLFFFRWTLLYISVFFATVRWFFLLWSIFDLFYILLNILVRSSPTRLRKRTSNLNKCVHSKNGKIRLTFSIVDEIQIY
jgi:hypothetical protein